MVSEGEYAQTLADEVQTVLLYRLVSLLAQLGLAKAASCGP